MKYLGLSTVLSFFTVIVFAQGALQVKMPSVLPASPEPTAIIKGAEMSAGLFTGSAQASIPLHVIKMNSFSLPISLNYSSNGTKVDEIPSRVGMNWVLNAGGSVNRIVHGNPDDQTTRLPTPISPSNYTQANYDFYNQVTAQANGTPASYDAEPDEFRYSAPGISGKFILDNNGNPVSIPYSHNKIQVFGGGTTRYSSVKITSIDGVIYEFGTDAIETTVNHTKISGIEGFQTINTAFFLRKITFPTKETIVFNYVPITTTSAVGASQSVTRSAGGNVMCQQTAAAPCETLTYTPISTSVSLVTYNTCYLQSIVSSDGTYANFFYQPRTDYSGDNRLTSLFVYLPGTTYREFRFEYTDQTAYSASGNPGGSLFTNTRFFLKNVKQVGGGGQTAADTLTYTFDYEDINGLPTRLSFAQDHYGYFNGANNSYLLPVTSDGYTWGGYALADRNPYPLFAMKGMLKKITYPTGGYDQFTYEGNTVPVSTQSNPYKSVNQGGSGIGASGTNTFTRTISVLRNQSINLYSEATYNMYYWQSINQTPPALDGTKPVTVQVKNLSTNTIIYSLVRLVNTSWTSQINLTANSSYEFKISITGEAYAGQMNFTYDTTATGASSFMTNATTGGIRVKNVLSYDPVSDKTTGKYFRYHYLSDTNLTSGSGSFIAGLGDYISKSYTKTYCSSCIGCYNLCNFETLSSNSTIPLYAYTSNLVVYKAVIESDDPYLANGGVEHQFYMPSVGGGLTVLNDGIRNVPNDTYTNNGGDESFTTVFNSSLTVLKKVEKRFGTGGVYTMVPVVTARRNFVHSLTLPYSDDDFLQFDASTYSWTSFWIHSDSTFTTEYDALGNVLSSYSVDSFGTVTNPMPLKSETMGSDGKKVAVYMKYPIDYTTSPYTDLVAANRMTPVIEKKTVVDGKQVAKVTTNYVKWFTGANNTPVVIEPGSILTQKTGTSTQESRIQFYGYDTTGNITEVAKESGSRISYFWDLARNNPIAEVKNASLTQDSLAYTSFEDAEKGKWSYTGAPSVDQSAPTGKMVYSLISGAISRPVSSLKGYWVSYWLKNGSGTATVNGSSGTALLVKNGWTCYRLSLSGSASVVVSGTGLIDELRLYPTGALMTTFTYNSGVGITSSSGPDNKLVRYEYDGFNRLVRIRDGDLNILKQTSYVFGQSITPCPNAVPNWQPVTGAICIQNGPNNTYTGTAQRQEKDINNCSPTYLQTRWVSATASCPNVPCTGVGWRVPNGGTNCVQGQMIMVYQIFVNGQWECKYYYYWPQDGYRSPDIISNDINICGLS